MIPWQIAIILECFVAFLIGASVGFIFRRRVVIPIVLAPLVALAILVAIEHARAGFPLRATLLQEFVGGFMFAAGPLLLIVCLPAFIGALFVVWRYRLQGRRWRDTNNKPAETS